MPLILRRQLEFPYDGGLPFVTALYDQGGCDAVNAAIQTPPASTEQVLHPEKYLRQRGAGRRSTRPTSAASLGERLVACLQQTMGELGDPGPRRRWRGAGVDVPGLPVEWPHAGASPRAGVAIA